MFPIFTDGRLQTASGARTVLSAKTCENHMCVCVCDWIKRHKVNFTATFFVFFFFAISSAAHRNTCTAWIKIKCGWERTVQRSELTHSQQAQTNTQTHTLQHFCKPKEIHSCYKSTHTHTHTHTHQRLGQCSLSVLPPQMWRWKRRNAECCSHCCKENIPYSVILYM